MVRRWLMVATLVGPSVLPAQTGAQEERIRSAERLEARAGVLAGTLTSRDQRRSAELLQEAAALRAATDLVAIDDLAQAGRMYRLWGDVAEAYAVVLEAFDRAIVAGDAYRAALAVLEAGELAVLQARLPAAERHIDRARLLLLSPTLSDVQRRVIREGVAAARESVAERRGR